MKFADFSQQVCSTIIILMSKNFVLGNLKSSFDINQCVPYCQLLYTNVNTVFAILFQLGLSLTVFLKG